MVARVSASYAPAPADGKRCRRSWHDKRLSEGPHVVPQPRTTSTPPPPRRATRGTRRPGCGAAPSLPCPPHRHRSLCEQIGLATAAGPARCARCRRRLRYPQRQEDGRRHPLRRRWAEGEWRTTIACLSRPSFTPARSGVVTPWSVRAARGERELTPAAERAAPCPPRRSAGRGPSLRPTRQGSVRATWSSRSFVETDLPACEKTVLEIPTVHGASLRAKNPVAMWGRCCGLGPE